MPMATPAFPTPEPSVTYTSHAEAVRDLGHLLTQALPVRYLAPPHAYGDSDGPNNPTMDTALHEDRLALSAEIDRTANVLRVHTRHLRIQEHRLRKALSKWAGDSDTAGIRALVAESSLRD